MVCIKKKTYYIFPENYHGRLENHHFFVLGDTFLNGCFSTVGFVFAGVVVIKPSSWFEKNMFTPIPGEMIQLSILFKWVVTTD